MSKLFIAGAVMAVIPWGFILAKAIRPRWETLGGVIQAIGTFLLLASLLRNP